MDEESLAHALQVLIDHHDMLRARLDRSGPDGVWTMRVPERGAVGAADLLVREDIAGLDAGEVQAAVDRQWIEAPGLLSPDDGVMVRAVWFDAGPRTPGRFLLVLHHFVTDGVSWRVLVPDLAAAWQAVAAGAGAELLPTGTSFRRWTELLADEAVRPARVEELPMWERILGGPDLPIGSRPLDPARDVSADERWFEVTLPVDRTAPLLTSVPAAFEAAPDEVLLAAFALAMASWRRERRGSDQTALLVDIEGHGRQETIGGADLSRSVGWFTTLCPMRLDPGPVDPSAVTSGAPVLRPAVERVRDQVREVPDDGIGFGLLRYLNPKTAPRLAEGRTPQVLFNYLGRFGSGAAGAGDNAERGDWDTAPGADVLAGAADPQSPLAHVLELNAFVEDGPEGPELHAVWLWPGGVLEEDDVRALADGWFTALAGIEAAASRPPDGSKP